MNPKISRLAAFLTVLFLCGCSSEPRHPALVGKPLAKIIPARDFVADREANADYQISPDGRRLAWRSVCGTHPCLRVRQLSGEEARSINIQPWNFRWAPDSRTLLWVQDRQGDGKGHVWALDLKQADVPPRDLTPGELTAQIHDIPGKAPNQIIVSHNRRDAKLFDLYRIDLTSGHEIALTKNPGDVQSWLTDPQGRLRGRIVQSGEKRRLEFRAEEGDQWTMRAEWTVFDTFETLGWTADGKHLWLASNLGRDKIALTRFQPDTGREEVYYADPSADIDVEGNKPIIGPKSGLPLAAVSEPDYPKVEIFHPALKAAAQQWLKQAPIRIHINSIDDAEAFATVDVFDGRGMRYYLLDLTSGKASLLGEDSLSRLRDHLSPTLPIQFKARDGFPLHGFLTIPSGLEAQKRLPLLLRVHGGPWYNNIWGNTHFWQAATQVQFFANRGYAVLEINFRGSTGYGKRYTEAAQGEFAAAMQTDLLDGVQWAIAQDIADPDKIAIMGGSYGGYATLVGLTFTPDRFACGIAHAAPNDLGRLLDEFPAYGVFDQPLWHRYVGNPQNPEARRTMEEKSPLYKASALNRPLLLTQGAQDILVKPGQASAFAERARASGKMVDLVIYPAAGHSLGRWQDNLDFYRRSEDFLANCLGGRSGGFDFYQLGNWLP